MGVLGRQHGWSDASYGVVAVVFGEPDATKSELAREASELVTAASAASAPLSSCTVASSRTDSGGIRPFDQGDRGAAPAPPPVQRVGGFGKRTDTSTGFVSWSPLGRSPSRPCGPAELSHRRGPHGFPSPTTSRRPS